ncbi:MAG: S53 family peptidase, partial [Solirubrobacteraceae bacterium]
MHATVALVPRRPAALAAYARAVSTPGSRLYRRYLSVAQFARRFGPRPAQVAAVRRRLRAHDLLSGPLSANGLELPVTAVANGSFVAALARRPVVGSAATGALAADVDGGLVQGVIGPGAPAPSASVIFGPAVRTARSRAMRPRLASAATTAPGPQPCPNAQAVTAAGAHTADQIASAYGLSGYYAAGDQGSGVTIAVYELEPFSATDLAAYQACYGTSANVQVVPIDGGAGNGPGSGEAAMDIEDLIGLAPQATIRVYEAPPTGAGAYDAYSRIVSDDSAQVISTSWGLCEALEGAASAQAESTLFEEAAVQGQSLLASAGDQGADDCGDGRQAVDDPASQPWVTAVGATSLQGTDNTVWNDALGSTGGGVSRLWSRPSYQAAAAQSQTSVPCGSAGNWCRELPDLSLDGDPATGYVVYWNGGWHVVGGSSVSAPTMAALTALADGSAACGGHPIGFLNPGLYAAAASPAGYAGDFADVTTGVNSFDAVPGFTAGPGYDMSSGLGVPGP